MALKALMLRKKISEATKKLEELRAKDADFDKREAELEAAIEEAETDEEKEVVEAEIEEFEKEKAENEEAKIELEKEVADLEKELDEQETEEPEESEEEPEEEKREVKTKMVTRNVIDEAFVRRDDVQAFLTETRTCMKEKRALTNVGLTIPTVMLEMLRENIDNYSKLYKHVSVSRVSGEARQVIMGGIPEAIWTDCCANLNELDLQFYVEEWNCWKLGGFFAICDATLEDSDLNLAQELIRVLGLAIGYALDKAILYGTGNRMPLGVVARLAQTSAPTGYPEDARPWVDLHTTNILTIAAGTTGAALIAEIVKDFGAAKGNFSRGTKVWLMNETTYTAIASATVTTDANGSIVTGVANTMPVIGGVIETLNFIPDNVIIAGYFDNYKLVERAGQKFATSEHVRFLQDQTVFKGTARYDGSPVIAEGFVAIGINGTTPTATMTFAPDVANTTNESNNDPAEG